MTDQDSPAFVRARARLGQVLQKKWHLDELLGVGGMAAVYGATHRNGMRGAVKMLDIELSTHENTRARFLREGYVANRVGHPGAVSVLDDDVAEDGSVYLVMELLEGSTVEAHARTRPGQRVPPEEALKMGVDLLDVLVAAHEKEIVHRDLKPENLFLTTRGEIKVLDFGIARFREMAGSMSATRTGDALGTPAFMPPEQALGNWDEVDARSDLWAAGATLFRLLTGEFVHAESNVQKMMLAAMTKPARPLASVLPSLSPGVCSVIDRALAFDRAARWPNARAMQDALRSVHKGSDAPEPPAMAARPGGLGVGAALGQVSLRPQAGSSSASAAPPAAPPAAPAPVTARSDERTEIVSRPASSLVPPAVRQAPAPALRARATVVLPDSPAQHTGRELPFRASPTPAPSSARPGVAPATPAHLQAPGAAPPPYSTGAHAAARTPPTFSTGPHAGGATQPIHSTGAHAAAATPPTFSTGAHAVVRAPPTFSTGAHAGGATQPIHSTGAHAAVPTQPPYSTGAHPAVAAQPPYSTGAHPAAAAQPPTFSTGAHPAAAAQPPYSTGAHAAVRTPPTFSTGAHPAAAAQPPYSTGAHAAVRTPPTFSTGAHPAAAAPSAHASGGHAAGPMPTQGGQSSAVAVTGIPVSRTLTPEGSTAPSRNTGVVVIGIGIATALVLACAVWLAVRSGGADPAAQPAPSAEPSSTAVAATATATATASASAGAASAAPSSEPVASSPAPSTVPSAARTASQQTGSPRGAASAQPPSGPKPR